jgi:MFS family permease
MSIGYFGTWFFFNTPFVPLIFLSLAVMCGTARWVVLSKYTNDCFESKYRATAISALSMLVGVFYIVITSSSGFLINYFHGMNSIFAVLGVMTILFVLPLAYKNVSE